MEAPATLVRVDLLEVHLEEIGNLWLRRGASLRSPDATLKTLSEIDGRMAAHLEGLAVGGPAGLALAGAALESDDSTTTFAGAYALLRLGGDVDKRRVLEAFLATDVGPRAGLCAALCDSPIDDLVRPLSDALGAAPSPLGAEIAEVLATHGALDPGSLELTGLMKDGNPLVRARAWRVVAIVDGKATG